MRGTYLGLFLTSLSALMLEILLTRIFSVVTWYYFAFFAISVAMFGFTIGALTVFLKKDWFPQEKLTRRMALVALLFGISTDIALCIFLSIPFHPRLTGVGVFSTVFVYLVISMPFVFAGIIVCLCLTRFPRKVGLLYAADLVGAGVGAFMVFPVLNAMDAPTAIFLVGATGAAGALFFMMAHKESTLYRTSAVVFFSLTFIMTVNFLFQPVSVEFVKMRYRKPVDEAWNAFSRIAVYPLHLRKIPYSWGLSPAFKPKEIIGERMLDIDGVSETVMTLFDGRLESVEHLKYDVTHIAHYLKNNAKVFVIGVGGGRDILAAKVFGQKEVVGAEINDRIIEMVNYRFGDFTGHLDKLPGVRIINDDARSAITRMDEKFDIIQASCIATWSATTAGAFSLAENSLYTVEAWKTFFDHLKPDGILSFNRWYSPDYPAQLLRLTSLAARTLSDAGAKDPGRHIVIVRNPARGHMPSATILVSKAPFSKEKLAKLRDVVKRLQFKFEYDPDGYRNPLFQSVIDNVNNSEFFRTTPLDLTPPTDNRPFFFYMLRPGDLFKGRELKFKEQRFNLEGITMLFVLLIVSILLCVAFIFAPLLYSLKKSAVKPPLGGLSVGLLFFAAIGFGYILVEIAMLQRLIIFLGHPIYSITVVIFAMLVSSGLGSLSSGYITGEKGARPRHITAALTALLVLLVAILYIQPALLKGFVMSGIYTRIAVSLLFLFPLGFLMGLPFPMGMSIAARKLKDFTPWFWAVNGATSVVSSVLSVCISISLGFTATLAAGIFCYVVASASLLALFYLRVKEHGAEKALERAAQAAPLG